MLVTPLLPQIGTVGNFRMPMYRGITDTKNHKEFSSDLGDYGRGDYWTSDRGFARNYGEVKEEIIELDKVYFIPKEELDFIIEKYQTCKMQLGHQLRLDGSKINQ